MPKKIPILMYHAIGPEGSPRLRDEEKFYNITPEKFKEQAQYLKDNGYTTLTLDELRRAENDKELPHKPVMLTFDDGHVSHYDTALPILKETGFTGVFFLVTNDIGKKDRVSWHQAKALKAEGMDIGSHGENHTIIEKYSAQNLIIELKTSKIDLEDNLGIEVTAFSVPRGLYSREISGAARGMGYRLVFTSFTGYASLSSDPYCLKRFVVRSDYEMEDFAAMLKNSPVFLIKRYLEQFAKNGIQKAIGIERYDQLKDMLTSRT